MNADFFLLISIIIFFVGFFAIFDALQKSDNFCAISAKEAKELGENETFDWIVRVVNTDSDGDFRFNSREGQRDTIVCKYYQEQKTPACPSVSVQPFDYEEMKKVCLFNQPSYSQLQQISQNNASEHEYVWGKYDCTEFSIQLISRLKDAGYQARLCLGMLDNNGTMTLHNWVKVENVYIEATNGKILEPDYYSIHYKNEVCK